MSGMRALARWAASLARRSGLTASPLRRRTDRIEGWLRVALVVVFLVGAPLAGVIAGRWTDAAMTQTAQSQAAADHYVAATLLHNAPAAATDPARGSFTWAQAKWKAPDGTMRSGQVEAPLGARAGTTVHVWTDAAGHLTEAPLTRSQITGRVLTAVILTVLAFSLLMLVVAATVHRMLDHRRMADWEDAWSAVEPQWTRRLH